MDARIGIAQTWAQLYITCIHATMASRLLREDDISIHVMLGVDHLAAQQYT